MYTFTIIKPMQLNLFCIIMLIKLNEENVKNYTDDLLIFNVDTKRNDEG